jgi:phosphatidate cytidylyltransferase
MKVNVLNIIFLIAVFISSLFLGKLSFSIIMSLFAVLSLREMLNIKNKDISFPIEIELLSYVILLFFVMNNYNNKIDFYYIDYKLLSILILTSLIPLVIFNNKNKYNLLDALYLCSSTLFIGITFNLLTQFRMHNIYYVMFILVIAVISSVFEFITNKYIGKYIFLPTIAPKKSIEGVLGGIVMSTIISTMFFISTITTDIPIYGIVIISFILSLAGQFGDLVFKFIKKEFNKPNFSKSNNGKSGILDIMDSVIFITLGFIMFVSIL